MNQQIIPYKYNVENFYYDELFNINSTKSRMKVYNNGKNKYDRIIIKSPRCKLVYNPNKYKTISLLLHPLVDETKTFYNFIKKIDKQNKKKFKELEVDKKTKYKSCISKTKYNNYMAQFSVFDNTTVFSSSKKQKKLSDISIDNEVSIFIELKHLWIDNKKMIKGCSWNIIQVKYYKPKIDINKCLFISDTEDSDEEIDYEPPKKREIKYVHKCLHCDSVSYSIGPRPDLYPRNNCIIPQPPPPPIMFIPKKKEKKSSTEIAQPIIKSFVPSVKDILNIKSRLKSSIQI